MKNIVVMAGPSGSGLSSVEFVFEELGYLVIKNPTVNSINAVVDDLINEKSELNNFCLMLNAGSGKEIFKILKKRKDALYRFIVLNCSEQELNKRYALSRHVHPRSARFKLSTSDAIKKDIKDILDIVNEADLYVDTSSLSVKQLRAMVYKFLAGIEDEKILSVTFISFGIKNGIPQGIDTFLDTRMIPNPYWNESLKELNGCDQPVIDYMMSFDVTKEVLKNLEKYLSSTLEEVAKDGRSSYTVGIACSGGQHRSTFVANHLCEYFSKKYRTQVIHRDSPQLNKE